MAQANTRDVLRHGGQNRKPGEGKMERTSRDALFLFLFFWGWGVLDVRSECLHIGPYLKLYEQT